MKITADTNVLVRIIVQDDPEQSATAAALLREATLIAVPLPCLCELVWVLRSSYALPASKIAIAVRAVLNTANLQTIRPAAEAGLAMLESGGDFADGVIAWEGEWLGAEVFVSFDRAAVKRLAAQGRPARLAGEI